MEADGDPERIRTLRTTTIRPLSQQILGWIKEEQYNVLPKNAIGKAMTYFVNQYPKFNNIFLDGRIELDNNLIENSIRPMAIGRKNYLFCGCHHAVFLLRQLQDARHHNPKEWLANTLQRTPGQSIQKLDELLPGYQEKPEV